MKRSMSLRGQLACAPSLALAGARGSAMGWYAQWRAKRAVFSGSGRQPAESAAAVCSLEGAALVVSVAVGVDGAVDGAVDEAADVADVPASSAGAPRSELDTADIASPAATIATRESAATPSRRSRRSARLDDAVGGCILAVSAKAAPRQDDPRVR